MANEGRISSFDGATLTHPELRIVGFQSVPPPQPIDWFGCCRLSAEDAQENFGVGGVCIINGISVMVGSTAGLNRFYAGLQWLVDIPDLPANAQIISASLSVLVMLVGPGPPIVNTYVEASDDAPLFTVAASNISSRNLHTIPITWDPIAPGWHNDIDVTGLVQYWHSIGGGPNKRISFIMKEITGAIGARATIWTWDSGPDATAILRIQYVLPGLV